MEHTRAVYVLQETLGRLKVRSHDAFGVAASIFVNELNCFIDIFDELYGALTIQILVVKGFGLLGRELDGAMESRP